MEAIVGLVAVAAPFLFVITIVWLVLHYKERRRLQRGAPVAEAMADNAELGRIAERMERRIEALEQILDSEAPGWRKKYEHS